MDLDTACGLTIVLLSTMLYGCADEGGAPANESSSGAQDGSEGSFGSSSDGSPSVSVSASAEASSEPPSADDEGSTTAPLECTAFEPSSCEPARMLGSTEAYWDFFSDGGIPDELIDVECTIIMRSTGSGTIAFNFECLSAASPNHGISLAAPALGTRLATLDAGDTVRVTHLIREVPHLNVWFTLRELDGTFIAGGVNSSELAHPEHPDVFAPLGMTLVEGVCPLECLEYDNTQLPTLMHRTALELSSPEASAEVVDGNSATLGSLVPYEARVEQSVSCVSGLVCDQGIDGWYEVLVYDARGG